MTARKPKPRSRPSKRTVTLARKVLASSGGRPALLHRDGKEWTLQWHELHALARATLTLAARPKPSALEESVRATVRAIRGKGKKRKI